jgi:sugar/nucleoside kinase (ribokinase family)
VLSELWGRRLLPWIKSAKREGALVSLDPQMSTKGKWSEPFRHILEHLDLLLLDEVEARKIARKKHTLDAIDSLMDKGVSVVAVKVGRRGCIVGENGRVRLTRAYRTKPVSTIGAGDAFDAAFIYGSLRGWPVEKTAKFSNVVAGLSTTKLGCMTAVPRARDAERIARSHYRSRW